MEDTFPDHLTHTQVTGNEDGLARKKPNGKFKQLWL
jgi:hypothetical protein